MGDVDRLSKVCSVCEFEVVLVLLLRGETSSDQSCWIIRVKMFAAYSLG